MNNVVCEPIVKMTEYKMGGALEVKNKGEGTCCNEKWKEIRGCRDMNLDRSLCTNTEARGDSSLFFILDLVRNILP